jgi:hypothetical protein
LAQQSRLGGQRCAFCKRRNDAVATGVEICLVDYPLASRIASCA